MSSLLKPLALPERPVVAVVAPASNARQDRLDAGADAMAARGWQLRWGAHARGKAAPYFSASPEERLADLHAAFADPEVDLVLCTRGGYGANYLLPGLNFDLIRAHPKPLFGYSDMTALQTALLDRTGLVTFHAPMLAADFCRPDGVDEPSLRAVMGGAPYTYCSREGLRTLRSGQAEGQLYGGCLALLVASLRTPWEAATEGKLLFVEDVGEKPHQVDRMLRQLLLAGKLDGVTGIVFGEMLECGPPEMLSEVILHALAPFGGPVAFGLRSGHVSGPVVTLPLGVQARLVADEVTAELTLLEHAVTGRADVRS